MSKQVLPEIILNYIDASNKHNVETYANTFSNDGIIEENSIVKEIIGKEEIKEYFTMYFVKTQTHTEIINYSVDKNFVDMRVLFKGNFAGKEIIGIYQFYLHNGQIVKLRADLE